MLWVVPWTSEQGGESCLKAEGFCVMALWKQKMVWHPSSGMEWRTHLHSPASFTAYFYQLLGCSHLGSLHSIGLSNMQGPWVLSQGLIKKVRSLVSWRHDARKAFVAPKRRVWIHPMPFINILKMLDWIPEQIHNREIKLKDLKKKKCWQKNKFILLGKILEMQSSSICIVKTLVRKD